MPDIFSKKDRSRMMACIKSRGNRSTELRLIQYFRANGISGWRRNSRLPGKPDFVFPKLRWAVFVDGCFWHACVDHWTAPKTRERFWRDKARDNRMRDRKANAAYRARGWMVLRVWEHDHGKFEAFADRIAKAVWRRMPPR